MDNENAILEHLDTSLAIRYYDLTKLTVPFHYHPQYELVCMEEGQGYRLIGDNLSEFKDDDMVFVSSFLPHVWKANKAINNVTTKFKYHVLHFTPEIMVNLLTFPELATIHNFLKKAECGLYIYGETRKKIRILIKEAYQATPINRFIYFLQILNTLQESTEVTSLSSINFARLHSTYKTDRMTKICEYIGDNFDKDITIEVISNIACMSPTSFCRYFKKETGISFINYLNDVRIGYAKTLLSMKKYKLTEIADICGFQSVSYFKRLFKQKNGISPSDYI